MDMSDEQAFQKGDKVRMVIDKVDPDMHYHGKEGEIIDIGFDDAGSVTGDSKDNFQYKVKLEDGDVPDIHFRRNDLKKISE
jgi:ribosomal protein L21E